MHIVSGRLDGYMQAWLTVRGPETFMRTEIEHVVDEIQQGMSLLRRHL
jgi:hypothetical protein